VYPADDDMDCFISGHLALCAGATVGKGTSAQYVIINQANQGGQCWLGYGLLQ